MAEEVWEEEALAAVVDTLEEDVEWTKGSEAEEDSTMDLI